MTQFTIPESIAKQIFNDSANLSCLAVVNQTFRNLAYLKASEIFQCLSADYGNLAMQWAFQNLDKKETSIAFQIDQLFARAGVRETRREAPVSTNPYSSLHLVDYMAPFVEAEGISALFYAIFSEAGPLLKKKMVSKRLSENPLEKAMQFKSILSQNRDELLSIERLSLEGADLRYLPKEISCLSGLKWLNLSGNRFHFLPTEVCSLRNLECLYLDNGALLSLPKEIGQMKTLKVLSVNRNMLVSLPEEIGELVELRALFVAYNKLKKLPASVKNLQMLKQLYLNNNCLKELPDALGDLAALQIFSASKNRIKKLPEGFSRLAQLEVFVMQDNLFDTFPAPLQRVESLREVYLCRNQIVVCLEEFPPGVRVHAEGNLDIGMGDVLSIAKVAPAAFFSTYSSLKEHKWKEFVDLPYHSFGPHVMDQGLYREREPGFMDSMYRCVNFLNSISFQRFSYNHYSLLLRNSISHLPPDIKMLSGEEGEGQWWRVDQDCEPCDLPINTFSPAAKVEFSALNEWISYLFGQEMRLGDVIKGFDDPSTWAVTYRLMHTEQRKTLFHFFLSEFVIEMQSAVEKKGVFRAIVRFTKSLEWMHAQRTELRRADKLLMDFLLTQYGFHPTLMNCSIPPHCQSIDEWMVFAEEGLTNWKNEVMWLEKSRRRIDIDEESDIAPMEIGPGLDSDG